METRLDLTFQAKRLELIRKVEDAVVQLWLDRDWGDRSTFVDRAIPMVEGGMAATVTLNEAYLNMKARAASGEAEAPDLDFGVAFSVEDVRGVPAEEVYERPFGALGAKLAEGAEFADADNEAAEYVRRLVNVDMQLALTNSSALWMALHA